MFLSFYLLHTQVDWRSGSLSEWNVSSLVTVTDVSLGSLCTPDPLMNKFILTKHVSHRFFEPLCKRLGGVVPVVASPEEAKDLHSDIFFALDQLDDDSSTQECDVVSGQTVKYLLGQKWEDNAWTDPYTEEKLQGNNSVLVNAHESVHAVPSPSVSSSSERPTFGSG